MPTPLFTLTRTGYYRAHNATITGDVSIAPDANIWFNAVVRGDVARVTIGRGVNVQDAAVIHCDSGHPNVIEDHVSIGHAAIVHGQFVGAHTLIGMGAKVLGKTRIGKRCLIAAGAVVPPGLEVPDGHVVMGVPGKIVRPLKPDEAHYLDWLAPHYVQLAQRYARGEITSVTD